MTGASALACVLWRLASSGARTKYIVAGIVTTQAVCCCGAGAAIPLSNIRGKA